MDQSSFIGTGIYTAADASRIFKIPYSKSKRWFRVYAKHKFENPDAVYHFRLGRLDVVNFHALIEMYVFLTLREKGISAHRIIEAHQTMSEYLKTPYPFAKEDLFISHRTLLFGDDQKYLITADKRLQTVIINVLRPFINKVEFDDNSRLANKFYPLGKSKSIVVNPVNQFGQPVIEGTNILAQTVVSMHRGGESQKSIAKLFDINLKQVNHAIEFASAA